MNVYEHLFWFLAKKCSILIAWFNDIIPKTIWLTIIYFTTVSREKKFWEFLRSLKFCCEYVLFSLMIAKCELKMDSAINSCQPNSSLKFVLKYSQWIFISSDEILSITYEFKYILNIRNAAFILFVLIQHLKLFE